MKVSHENDSTRIAELEAENEQLKKQIIELTEAWRRAVAFQKEIYEEQKRQIHSEMDGLRNRLSTLD